MAGEGKKEYSGIKVGCNMISGAEAMFERRECLLFVA
jgi:hypothetical protein